MYDLVFLTRIPAFYKINLYNEIAKKRKIFVIFISKYQVNRDESFFEGEKTFEYIYLDEILYKNRNSIKNSLKLWKLLKTLKYKKLVLGGWDSLENWTGLLVSSKKQNCVVVESSEFESSNKGIKGLLKKKFISRISLGFASGESQVNLLRNVGYKGEIKITNGVGIFNTNKQTNKQYSNKKIKKFLYVGRLSAEKNIEQLIRIFNNLPDLELNIVGYGPLEKELKKMSKKNINFLGKINNEELSKIYQNNDVFILPSKSEPWGLVVEEALYNGLPVILSNKVGCHATLVNKDDVGYIYDVEKDEELIDKINEIRKIENYLFKVANVKKLDFGKIKEEQIKAYLL